MSHTHTSLTYHLVFSTKNRVQSISSAIRPDLCRYLGGIVTSEGGLPLEINAVADHVHILTRLPPNVALAEFLRTLKANSSKWLNDTRFRARTFAWQQGYSAFTVSQSQVGRVAAYIRNQEDHHRKMTFRQELVALLKRKCHLRRSLSPGMKNEFRAIARRSVAPAGASAHECDFFSQRLHAGLCSVAPLAGGCDQ